MSHQLVKMSPLMSINLSFQPTVYSLGRGVWVNLEQTNLGSSSFSANLELSNNQTLTPSFRRILNKNNGPHAYIYIRGLAFPDLIGIINFMYQGETKVPGENLARFLQAAQAEFVIGFSGFSMSYIWSKICMPGLTADMIMLFISEISYKPKGVQANS